MAIAMDIAAEKENIKARQDIEPPLRLLVGRLAKVQLSRVKRLALTFSFSGLIRSYWGACWHGMTRPFVFRINGEIQKDTLVGRVAFAATYIIVDSAVLMGRYLFKCRVPWEVIAIIAVVITLADSVKASDFKWLLVVPPVAMVGAVPFSILRFRKWKGFKPLLKKKVAPIVDGEDNKGEII